MAARGIALAIAVAVASLLAPTPASAQALEEFTFCTDAPDGGGSVHHDPWNFGNGTWLVSGWLYHPAHTHDRALRVDGLRKYSTLGGDCTRFPSASFAVASVDGPGTATWTTPEAEVTETLTEVRDGACCGLLVEIRVTNRDVVPHAFEWRIYHDTAFGPAPAGGRCFDAGSLQPTVDGGPIEVSGVRYENEVDLLAVGGDTCLGQVAMFSAEDDTLRSSFEMLPPDPPAVMEFLRWPNGSEPCTTWSGMVDGDLGTGCNDNSLLLIWRFPATTGQLAPGESAVARYRIGWGCRWPCAGCAEPVLFGGDATDFSDCHDGITLTWDDASFPAPGNGVYHVYRSDVSFAQALASPPITPLATGITATTWTDSMTVPGVPYFYVVRAESTDFPGCGAGPLVSGSTAELNLGPVPDAADLAPPAGIVGSTLRATGKTSDTVDFNWLLAPLPAPGESYVILRSDDRPDGIFVRQASVTSQSWTDPAAPPRYEPVHVWFYDVRLATACGQLSPD